MFWIIVGGTLLGFFILLGFSLCKSAGRADRAMELNFRKLDSENAAKVVKVSFGNPSKDIMLKGATDVNDTNQPSENSIGIAKIDLAGFKRKSMKN